MTVNQDVDGLTPTCRNFTQFSININNPQSRSNILENLVIFFQIFHDLPNLWGCKVLSTTIWKVYCFPTRDLITIHDSSRMSNGYPQQGNSLLWNVHEHIIMDYYVVLLHSSFLSINIGFKEHVSVKHNTEPVHTEDPLHWYRVIITYFWRLTLNK